MMARSMLFIAVALAVIAGRSSGQEITEIHPFDLTLDVSFSSTYGNGGADSFAVFFEHPDGPGTVVESLRVRVFLDDMHGRVTPSSGTLLSATLEAGIQFGGETVGPELSQDQEFFDVTRTNGLVFFPEGQGAGGQEPPVRPTVLTYEFGAGNIPELFQLNHVINGFVVQPEFGSGIASITSRGRVEVTYNVGPATLVRVLDISGTRGRGAESDFPFHAIYVVEVPQSVIDDGGAIGVAEEVEGVVVVLRGGAGDPQTVEVGTQIFVGDVLETFEASSLTLRFISQSSLELTENGRLAIDTYRFDYVADLDAESIGEGIQMLKGIYRLFMQQVDRDEGYDSDSDSLQGSVGLRDRSTSGRGEEEVATMEAVRAFRAQSDPFEVAFDYLLVDPAMTMEVFMDDILLTTIERGELDPDPTDFTRVVLPIDQENGVTIGPVLLRFVVTGPVGSEFLVDNVTGPGFTDPTFDQGPRTWFVIGDGAGTLAGVVYGERCRGSGDYTQDQSMSLNSGAGGFKDTLVLENVDLNVDGKQDIVVIAGDTTLFDGEALLSTMSVHFGAGDGTFADPVIYQLEAPVSQLRVVDLDRDGFTDVLFISDPHNNPASAAYDDGIVYMENDGAGDLLAPVTLTQAPVNDPRVHSFAVLDVDGDSRLDILYSSGSVFGLQLLRGLEGGGFGVETTAHSGVLADAMTSADFDGDGDTDVLAAISGGGTTLFLNDGTGVFSAGPSTASGSQTKKLLAADLDGDTNLDVVQLHEQASEGGVVVYLGDGAGGLKLDASHDLGLNIFARLADVEVGDIDNDGDLDLAVITTDGGVNTVILRNDGAGQFAEASVSGNGPFALAGRGVALADTNRDGALDVIGDVGLVDRIGTWRNGCREVCIADLSEPFGVLDFDDVLAFLVAFGSGDSAADLAEPTGVLDFDDVLAFLISFGSGCP